MPDELQVMTVKQELTRVEKLRRAVKALYGNPILDRRGAQAELAEMFKVSRQRVHQIVNEERRRRSHLVA